MAAGQGKVISHAHCVHGTVSAGVSKSTGVGYQFKRILHAILGGVRAIKTLDFQ